MATAQAHTGNGSHLLLIHGFPHDRSLWKPQLEGLGGDIRVIAPDLRGFGNSTEVPDIMTMDAYASDLKELLDQLGVQRAVICGLSMGGYIALAFLTNHPEAVDGLILCNTRSGADDEKGRAGRYATATKVGDEGMANVAEGMVPKMMTEATATLHPERRATVKDMMARQRPTAVIAALRGMAERPDRTPMLATIKVPTLIITGSKDELILPEESEAMAAAIPESKLVIIPDVAHLSNVEDPDAFNKTVQEFMEGLE